MRFSWRRCTESPIRCGPSFYALLGPDQKLSPAIVTTREGGSSTCGCDGLNLSFKVGDNPDNVSRNRKSLMRTLHLLEDELAWPEQVHGSQVTVADAPGEYKGADGLVISMPKLWAAILIADCVPVLLFNDDFSAVGLAHAGRKGTQAGITKNLISKMRSTFNLSSRDLVVALGPSIGPCCYELDRITALQLPESFLVEREGKLFFDLWSANAAQAREEGISEDSIVRPPVCTCCEARTFFSHRAQRGKTGRQIAVTRPGGIKVCGGLAG